MNDEQPARRNDDEHTRNIVRLTVNEIFDGVGIDFATARGRQRFRNNLTFLDDAVSGTKAMKKAAWGAAGMGAIAGIWKVGPAIMIWLSR